MPSPDPGEARTQRTHLSQDGRLEERSAGALVFRMTKSGPVYLLLRYPAGHWDFPKGNIEEGETPIETMHREVREETGLTKVRPVEGFEHSVEYFYKRDGKRIHKQVTFFLAESLEDRVTLSFEHQDYTWKPFDEAMNVVTYANSRKLLRAANEVFRALASKR